VKTYTPSAKDIVHKWHVIDASDKMLGRLAVEVVKLLMGKHKTMFAPHIDTGDYVVVINAAKIKVSGKKPEQKIYYRYSGYHGGLKKPTYKTVFGRNPARVIELAVKGMLPHNSLGAAMFRKLRVYSDDVHPHQGQLVEKGSDS